MVRPTAGGAGARGGRKLHVLRSSSRKKKLWALIFSFTSSFSHIIVIMDSAANRASMAGFDAYKANDLLLAISHFSTALKLTNRVSIQFAGISSELACCYNSLNPPESETALSYADQALMVVLSLDHTNAHVASCHAMCERRRGTALSNIGRTTEAIVAFEAVLSLHGTTLLGNAHLADTLIDLAYCLRATGEAGKGLLHLGRADSLLHGTSNDALNSLQLRMAIANCRGDFYNLLGRHEKALLQYQLFLSLAIQTNGVDSPNHARALSTLGTAFNLAGQVSKATSSLRSAIALMEKLGMVDTDDYAGALDSYGVILAGAGDYQQALLMWQRSLAMYRRFLHPEHPTLARVLLNTARIQGILGDVEGSAQSHANCLSIARRSQTACAGPGCSKKLREDGAALDVCVNCRRTFY